MAQAVTAQAAGAADDAEEESARTALEPHLSGKHKTLSAIMLWWRR